MPAAFLTSCGKAEQILRTPDHKCINIRQMSVLYTIYYLLNTSQTYTTGLEKEKYQRYPITLCIYYFFYNEQNLIPDR